MLRRITLNVGRYEAGNTHDYPKGVWDKIARDLQADPRNKAVFKGTKPGDADAALKAFSAPQEFNPGHQSVTRGELQVRNRLGSPERKLAPDRVPVRARA